MSKSKRKTSKSYSRKNPKSSEASYNDREFDLKKDIPKKNIEYMRSKYKNTNNTNELDTIGENYNDEFLKKLVMN